MNHFSVHELIKRNFDECAVDKNKRIEVFILTQISGSVLHSWIPIGRCLTSAFDKSTYNTALGPLTCTIHANIYKIMINLKRYNY